MFVHHMSFESMDKKGSHGISIPELVHKCIDAQDELARIKVVQFKGVSGHRGVETIERIIKLHEGDSSSRHITGVITNIDQPAPEQP